MGTDGKSNVDSKRADSGFPALTVSILALVVSAVGIFYNHAQLRESERSREQSFIGQRPYLGIDNASILPSKQVQLSIKNYGASPAHHVQVDYSCGYKTPKGEEHTIGTFSEYSDANGGGGSGSFNSGEEARVFNPGATALVRCKGFGPDSKQVYSNLIHGLISYQDLSGTTHKADFCYEASSTATGRMDQCNIGNTVD
ncbi:MAG TPA: hypothetical protein VNZ47_13700 [Candidatus Dormibacteraeota bacterium]|nr:hypothetical protein [Candidatus Dormibacteraeota bacterium]